MSQKNIPQYIILFIFAGLLSLLVWPYLGPIIFAAFFAVVFYPVSNFFQKRLKMSENLATFLTVFLTIIFILGPLSLLLGLVAKEAIIFNQNFDKNAALGLLNQYSQFDILGYHINISDFESQIQELLKKASEQMLTFAERSLSSLSNFTFQFFVFLFLYFYGLRDGKQLIKRTKVVIPFTTTQKNRLLKEFKSVSQTVFIGNIAGAVLSGFFAYIGFAIFGLKAPLIWALLAAILSLLPSIGTFIVYAIGSAIAATFLNIYAGLALFAYFLIIEIALVQNYLRPKMLDDKIQVHPILVFFSLAGGVQVFGSAGIIYGPLIVVLFMTIFEFSIESKINKRED